MYFQELWACFQDVDLTFIHFQWVLLKTRKYLVSLFKTLRDSEIVKRGLSLVKVKVTPKTRSEVIEITNVFRAKIVDISPNTLTIELTGHNTKLNAFIDLVEPYGIEEIARTGMTALERGANTLKLDK